MSSGMLANMLGMGVTVQLLDMFTDTANKVVSSSDKVAGKLQQDANRTNNAWNSMFVGGALAASGLGVLHTIANLGKKALESSSQLEIFRNQFHVMISDYQWAEKVYNDSIKFAATTPFTIPEVVGAAKTLRAFGFQANQIGGELKIAGDWAAMFGERIEKTSEIMGRAMAGGYGRALVYMRGKGINDKDIQDAARMQGTFSQLFDASGRTKRGYDGNQMVAAMNQVIASKYGGEMDKRMGTVPGMWSNIQDQMILLLSRVGGEFKPRLKSLMHIMLKDITGESMANLGKALGQGLDVLLKVLGAIAIPLQKVVVWLGNLSEHHPAFVKWGVAITGAAGALLFLIGTWMTWIGISKLWEVSGIVDRFVKLRTAIGGFISGPLWWLVGAATILYFAWQYNIGGIQDHMRKWWNLSKLVFNAIAEGFASIQNGVVTFSTETYGALEKAGIATWTINVMAVLYRLYRVALGVWDAFKDIYTVLGSVASIMAIVLWPVMKLVDWTMRLIGVTSGLADTMSGGAYQRFGYILGWVLGIVVALNGWTRVTAAATAIWTAVTWAANTAGSVFAFAALSMQYGLWATTAAVFPATAAVTAFTAALWANPITWIVAAILLLIIGIVMLVKHWREIHAWIMKSADWILTIMPFVSLPLLIIKHWSQVKQFFVELGHSIKGIWNSVTDWIFDKIAAVIAFFTRMMVKITQFLPNWLKPESLRSLDNIDPDKIDSKFVRNFASNTLDGYRQARLQGSSITSAYAAGVASNNNLVDSISRKPSQPIQLHSTLQLDGRTVARTTQTYMNEEAASGRTF